MEPRDRPAEESLRTEFKQGGTDVPALTAKFITHDHLIQVRLVDYLLGATWPL